jgi:hypothetical protein
VSGPVVVSQVLSSVLAWGLTCWFVPRRPIGTGRFSPLVLSRCRIDLGLRVTPVRDPADRPGMGASVLDLLIRRRLSARCRVKPPEDELGGRWWLGRGLTHDDAPEGCQYPGTASWAPLLDAVPSCPPLLLQLRRDGKVELATSTPDVPSKNSRAVPGCRRRRLPSPAYRSFESSNVDFDNE